jgi:hypothetical protein
MKPYDSIFSRFWEDDLGSGNSFFGLPAFKLGNLASDSANLSFSNIDFEAVSLSIFLSESLIEAESFDFSSLTWAVFVPETEAERGLGD